MCKGIAAPYQVPTPVSTARWINPCTSIDQRSQLVVVDLDDGWRGRGQKNTTELTVVVHDGEAWWLDGRGEDTGAAWVQSTEKRDLK